MGCGDMCGFNSVKDKHLSPPHEPHGYFVKDILIRFFGLTPLSQVRRECSIR